MDSQLLTTYNVAHNWLHSVTLQQNNTRNNMQKIYIDKRTYAHMCEMAAEQEYDLWPLQMPYLPKSGQSDYQFDLYNTTHSDIVYLWIHRLQTK